MSTSSDRYEVELALEKVTSAYNDFTLFYGKLVERGIEETAYGKVFEKMAKEFRELYAGAKSHHDALLLNKTEFDEGRLERSAFERRLQRIVEYIIGVEFDINIKILPHLRKVENEILNDDILKTVEKLDVSEAVKKEVKQDAEEIKVSMFNAEQKKPIDQVNDYVGIGGKIADLGKKVWKYAGKVAPHVPAILKILGSS